MKSKFSVWCADPLPKPKVQCVLNFPLFPSHSTQSRYLVSAPPSSYSLFQEMRTLMGCFTWVPWSTEIALGVARGVQSKGVRCVSLGPSIQQYVWQCLFIFSHHQLSLLIVLCLQFSPLQHYLLPLLVFPVLGSEHLPAVADSEVQAHDILWMLTTYSHSRVLF